MAKVFRVTPKKVRKVNGTILTPSMSLVVTTKQHTSSPFNSGAVELKEAYMRIYAFDYEKAKCYKSDFIVEQLD